MASCTFPRPTSISHHHRRDRAPPPIFESTTTTTYSLTLCFSSSGINHRHLFPFKRNTLSGRCRASSPQSEPPSEKRLSPLSGATAAFTRFQDTLQIFFAVLFWLSLFFWSSAWKRGNDDRPNKGSRFRK